LDLLVDILDHNLEIKERAKKLEEMMENKAKNQLREIQRKVNDMRDDIIELKTRVNALEIQVDRNKGMVNTLWYFMKESQRIGAVCGYQKRGKW